MNTDTRPWNIESSYYQATRSKVRTQFDGLSFKASKPLRAWGPQLLNIIGWAFLIGLIVFFLAVV